ncbi:hypothetical protein [Paraclostridium sp. AKS81]|uniref:hypothetical protein n=1 Tax=Paraclostridium sp. AKS81 TaxID=2876117 RepID=UPI0021DF6D90|nr:hypothetical protein [Paraclostridium sp. AKS81]MCU9813319.1 hypothetical protein [Paraclostridium sp. AKS81]
MIEILGITRDQFKQIVMLPQGEFKKLLLADSLEREGIFRKIFNTYDFEKIQIDLKEKAISLSKNRNKSKDEMQTNLKNIKGEHDISIGEYVDFPFVIEKLKDFISKDSEAYKNLNEDDKALYNELELINKEKVKIENNNNLLKEKEKIDNSLLDLINKEKEFEIKKETINKCKSAKDVKYIEDKLIENENILEQRKKSYEETLLNIERLNKEADIAKSNLKIEEAKEPERDALKLEINKLESIRPKIAEFDELKNSLIIKTESIEEIKSKIEDNKKVNENLKNKKLENENKLKEIATAETQKVEIANEISNKEKIIQETRELFKIIASYEKSKLSHNNLKIEYDSFEKVYKSIKKNYNDMDELYKKEQAGILACSLKENTPCPVCGSKNHPNPAVISKNLIVPTKEELKIAKEKLEEAEKENNLKINELTKLNTDCKNYFEIVSNSLLKFSKTLNIDENYSAKTAEIVKLKGLELKGNIDDLNKELIKINEKLSMKKI